MTQYLLLSLELQTVNHSGSILLCCYDKPNNYALCYSQILSEIHQYTKTELAGMIEAVGSYSGNANKAELQQHLVDLLHKKRIQTTTTTTGNPTTPITTTIVPLGSLIKKSTGVSISTPLVPLGSLVNNTTTTTTSEIHQPLPKPTNDNGVYLNL